MNFNESSTPARRLRYSFARVPETMSMPSLIEMQRRSYYEFLQSDVAPEMRANKGLQAALRALFPVTDFSGKIQLEFDSYVLEEPKYDLNEAREKGLNYAAPLRAKLRLVVWEDDEVEGELKQKTSSSPKSIKYVRDQEVYFGDIPLMTEQGTFLINGIERVVVSQMQRSPGVFFDHDRGSAQAGKYLFLARIIPSQGSWLDFEFDTKDLLCVRIDRKRKIFATTLLMALEAEGFEEAESMHRPGMSRSDILKTFYEVNTCVYAQGSWAIPLRESVFKGLRLEHDLVAADSGALLAEAGEKLSVRHIRKWSAEGVTRVIMPDAYLIGKFLAQDVVDSSTGEVYAQAADEISSELLQSLVKKGVSEIEVLEIDYVHSGPALRNTVLADKNASRTDALFEIYRILRPGETPTLESAYALFHNLFFNSERYDLSDVGRFKMNKRLGLSTDLSVHTLEKQDVVEIVRYLLNLKQGIGKVDDIDSLENRRVRSVGELLESEYKSGLQRMQRGIRERMATLDVDTGMPNDLLNARPLFAIIREFFGTSQLSQFMDQTNPLSEVNHKRRLSALGPGGLTRDRAGIEVRDVHPTHYGRICPIETPEGANIGLINSLAVYARINPYGFLETPYRRVTNLQLTDEIVYVSAMEEEKYKIAQANVAVDAHRCMTEKLVSCRHAGNHIFCPPEEVDLVDVSPRQIVSVAAALIPFIENDDANRALMGSNMQRQAVPLMNADAPLIGTGIEGVVASDSGVVVRAARSGIVDQMESGRIVVRCSGEEDAESEGAVDIYTLSKFRKSNAGTCVHHKPLVNRGQHVKKGEVIADGAATDLGELALGRNVLVAFMSWNGYCFEDSIILSQRLVTEDVFTSIHIEELEVSARDMKLGYEEITRDIPGVGEEALRHLDETGVAYIGAEVAAGDILVGKVSPKAEVPLTPEEKLLRAIFADKASDMKDTSLRVPSGVSGTVVDVRIFSRRGIEKDNRALAIEREVVARLAQERDVSSRILEQSFSAALKDLLIGKELSKKSGPLSAKDLLTEENWGKLSRVEQSKVSVTDMETMTRLEGLVSRHQKALLDVQKQFDQKVEKVRRGDELQAGVLKTVKIFLAVKRKIQPGDKMAGRHGNKGVVSIVVPEEDMPHLADGTPIDMILNPLGLPSRMNIGQILETHLGWASRGFGQQAKKILEEAVFEEEAKGVEILKKGLKEMYSKPELTQHIDSLDAGSLLKLADQTIKGMPMACPVFEGAKIADIEKALTDAGCSSSGQEILYDGRTGQPFDRPITVGIMYMLKLHHLVDEKIHARSIGPYSLVTQQPLGGKAQFGGQRFGEMEVWALQAYGASRTLLEMLTIKSDDLQGRTEVYKSIIKGVESFGSEIPESFNVLVKELKTLGLNVECLQDAPDQSLAV
jgi:DNA-directed RNA polymerase subunit beta